MGLVTVLMSVVMRLVAAVKQMLCFLHLRRRRKNSGNILPFHADMKVLSSVGEVQQMSLPSNDVELESWDSWGPDDRSELAHRNTAESTTTRYGNRYPQRKAPEPEPEPEIDYFQELHLEPSIRKTTKIIVRKKEDHSSSAYTGGISSRLAMASDIPLTGNELGTLEDMENAGWANEAVEDLSMEAEYALREKRRLERERRLAEHQLKKHEKEVNRLVVSKKERIAAVKMS